MAVPTQHDQIDPPRMRKLENRGGVGSDPELDL
jgi:hypothetical protein